MAVDMLEVARSKRQQIEEAERQERIADLQDRLLPFLIKDLNGTLTESDAQTLLEIVDDLQITDSEYRLMREQALATSRDYAQLQNKIPKLENEKLRMARYSVARRRAERALELANNSLRQGGHLRDQINGFQLALEHRRDSHPYFFSADGEPLKEIAELAPPITEPKATKPKTCAICLSEHHDDHALCSGRCRHIAADHYEHLVKLAILKEEK